MILNIFLALFFNILSQVAYAVTVVFEHPYDSRNDVVEQFILEDEDISVGELTLMALHATQLPYQGSESGMVSIFGTPTGLDAMEVISDDEMKAYGWCFFIDGEIADRYPHQINIDTSMQELRWFYAYAHMVNGEWENMCIPAR